jgi:hypothetical protein
MEIPPRRSRRGIAATRESYRRAPATAASFIENRNFDLGSTDDMLEEPGGKLWSIAFLVPSCPSQSLTSVVAIVDWWRFCLAKGRLDPDGEIVSSTPTEPSLV